MEKRLVAQGPKDRKSYTVTLPKEWVKSKALDKTKLVYLDIIGNKIVISAVKEQLARALINAKDTKSEIKKLLPLLYRLGIEEIKLINLNQELLDTVTEMIEQRLIGFEIVEYNKEYCIIKDISKSSPEEFKTALRRAFLMLLQLSEECLESMEKQKKLNSINNLDKGVNRLTNFCRRILMKFGHPNYAKVPFYYILALSIEQIGDEYKWFYEACNKKKGIFNKKDVKYFKEVNDFLRKTYELMYSFNVDKMQTLSNKVYQLKQNLLDLVENKVTAHYLTSITRRISSLISTVFEVNYPLESVQ